MELQEFRWTRENEQTKERVNDADYGRQYCVSQHCWRGKYEKLRT